MLAISNPGEIERGALALLGASVKDAAQIGKFGSGFKYALATLLRERVAVRIFSGLHEIPITTEIEKFRDHNFQVLVIDGTRTSITTNTGPEWKIRDAIREIWSNALDEGDAKMSTSDLAPVAGRTTVLIDSSSNAVKSMLANWGMYFVHNEPAVFESKAYGRILEQKVPNYYRRGVWICEDREMIGFFGYDFTDIELPESRKVASSATIYYIYRLLSDCNNPAVFTKILETRDLQKAEWVALTHWGLSLGNGVKALREAFFAKWDFIGDEKNRKEVSKLAGTRRVYWAEGQVLGVLTNSKYGLPRIETEVDYNDAYTIQPWPIGYEERLEPALQFLAENGIDLSAFEIKYAEFSTDLGVIALADMKTNRCLLSARAFQVDESMLLKALIEEWTHLQHKVADYTPQQQHVYLDLIVRLMKGN